MSIPLTCNKCGEVIGRKTELCLCIRGLSGDFDPSLDVNCPGEGNHSQPKRTERKRFFGLLRRVHQQYPETRTTSSWDEYAGPPNKFFLWLTIFFGNTGGTGGVLVNHHWVWWSLRHGFSDGVAELVKLKKN